MTIITLTTDFGTADGYVGAMKGIILNLAPDVTLVDISHAVPAQDVRHGARVLATAVPFFPTGTIHTAVVDPGVGSARQGIALQTPDAILVGPDNGLFTPFLPARTACVALTNPAAQRHPLSATFHGRDLFAPAAAHLANGMPLAELGPPVDEPLSLPALRPRRQPDGSLQAQVIHVDRFGNLATNVELATTPQQVRDDLRVTVAGQTLKVRHTYADVAPGESLALIGSDGHLEIAVREGSAAERLGAGLGAVVQVWGL